MHVTIKNGVLHRACERSGKRSGAGRKPTWAERSGERAKSAAQNIRSTI